MKLLASITAGALVVVFATFALFVVSGKAAETICGRASWYSYTGHLTANGERFDGSGLTAASRTLPFGTRLRVTYQGRAVVVRINDRGPYIAGRFLDLSRAAAVAIGLTHAGVGRVCAERL